MHSGVRPDGYLQRDFEENRHFWNLISTASSFRERLLEKAAISAAVRERRSDVTFSVGENAKRLIWQLLYRPLLWIGINPMEVRDLLLYGRKGGYIRSLRRLRGLADKR